MKTTGTLRQTAQALKHTLTGHELPRVAIQGDSSPEFGHLGDSERWEPMEHTPSVGPWLSHLHPTFKTAPFHRRLPSTLRQVLAEASLLPPRSPADPSPWVQCFYKGWLSLQHVLHFRLSLFNCLSSPMDPRFLRQLGSPLHT